MPDNLTITMSRSEKKSQSSVEIRPKTAVLVKPKILNSEKLGQMGIDMAQTRKDGITASLAKLILPVSGSRRIIKKHLATMQRKNSDLLESTSKTSVLSPLKVPPTKPIPQSFSKKSTAKPSGRSVAVPMPCTSCNRSDLPERFHSHPHQVFQVEKSSSNFSQRSRVIRKNNSVEVTRLNETSRRLTELNLKERQSSSSSSSEIGSQEANPHLEEVPASSSSKQHRFLLCYICGRLFGTSSLRIHQPQCYQKWERENLKLPPSLRRLPPEHPGLCATFEEWNNLAYASFEKTKKSTCRRSSSESETNDKVSSLRTALGSRDLKLRAAVTSNVCGGKYGTRSMTIHEPQCSHKRPLGSNTQSPIRLLKPESSGIIN